MFSSALLCFPNCLQCNIFVVRKNIPLSKQIRKAIVPMVYCVYTLPLASFGLGTSVLFSPRSFLALLSHRHLFTTLEFTEFPLWVACLILTASLWVKTSDCFHFTDETAEP